MAVHFEAWCNTNEMKMDGVEYDISLALIMLDERKINHLNITCLQ